jgi:calnexin
MRFYATAALSAAALLAGSVNADAQSVLSEASSSVSSAATEASSSVESATSTSSIEVPTFTVSPSPHRCHQFHLVHD